MYEQADKIELQEGDVALVIKGNDFMLVGNLDPNAGVTNATMFLAGVYAKVAQDPDWAKQLSRELAEAIAESEPDDDR